MFELDFWFEVFKYVSIGWLSYRFGRRVGKWEKNHNNKKCTYEDDTREGK